MERKPSLTGDLAALAEQERSRLGEPPDAELLIAFHEGELPEDEMERVRDWLAVDPEWASIYLDLKRGGLGAGGVASAGLDASGVEDPEVEAAWRALAPKLKREAPAAEVVPFPRRGSGRTLLALAAAAVVAAGLAWLLTASLLEGEYYHVDLSAVTFRGGQIPVPRSSVGVAFHIRAPDLSGRLVVELLDASKGVVRQDKKLVKPGTEEIVFRVTSSSLLDRRAYQIIVRPPGGSPNERLFECAFTIVFED